MTTKHYSKSITPIGNRVYLSPSPKGQSTKSGIILSSTITEQYSIGVVLSVGDKCLVVKVGDSVLYTTTSGTKIEANLMLSEEELLAII
tara:strand:- start:12 stop:278 length:267 start_codon:yes stop_codon:yes gene_type:complete